MQIGKFPNIKIVKYGKNKRIYDAVYDISKNDKNIFKFLTTFERVFALIYTERLFSFKFD